MVQFYWVCSGQLLMAHINLSNKRLSQYLSGLFVFQLAARYGNFSSAADALGLTQSSISQRIKRLELDLGVSLFARQARGVTLTHEGVRLLNAVGPAMTQIHNSVTSLMERNLKPRVRISADFAFSTLWLMPRLSQLRSELDDEVCLVIKIRSSEFRKKLAYRIN